jgi:hypothetical protein
MLGFFCLSLVSGAPTFVAALTEIPLLQGTLFLSEIKTAKLSLGRCDIPKIGLTPSPDN